MSVSAPVRRTPAQAQPAARRPLFIIGIAMSLLAFVLVLVLGVVLAGRATVGTAQATVVVAAHNISHRTVIGPGDLTVAKLPVSAVPAGALLQSTQAVGKTAQVDVLAGQPVTTNLVSASGSGDPGFLPIPQGWIAVTLPSSELQAVGGYVVGGDVIDIAVLLSESVLNPQVQYPRQFEKIVFPGIHVLKVGPAPADTGKSSQVQGVTSSLTMLMTPCDVQYLNWLVANGTLRYALRAAKDYGAPPTAPDSSCPVGTPPIRIGPAEVDRQYGFTR
jgi:pilus assembly protein CpaB